MELVRELAIKTLYIFHFNSNIPVKRIGVYPDERREAAKKIIKHYKTRLTDSDVEHEIYNIAIKYIWQI